VLAGTPGSEDFEALARVVRTHFGPRRVLLAAVGGASGRSGDGEAWLATRMPLLAAMQPLDGRAAAYVCENFTCQLPTADPAELQRLLGT
jgi:uncharacterized protein YyaL (SSP411 family)